MSTVRRLQSTLDRIDRKGYGAYKDLQGTYDLGTFSLCIDRVQRDPFAPPSLIRIRTKENAFDPGLFVDHLLADTQKAEDAIHHFREATLPRPASVRLVQ